LVSDWQHQLASFVGAEIIIDNHLVYVEFRGWYLRPEREDMARIQRTASAQQAIKRLDMVSEVAGRKAALQLDLPTSCLRPRLYFEIRRCDPHVVPNPEAAK
jgi:hypothetical protein